MITETFATSPDAAEAERGLWRGLDRTKMTEEQSATLRELHAKANDAAQSYRRVFVTWDNARTQEQLNASHAAGSNQRLTLDQYLTFRATLPTVHVEAPTAEPILIRVKREFCGHSSRVTGWEWAEAPPHVKRFISGDFGAVVLELATLGYAFSVDVESTEICLIEWLGSER